MSRNHNVITQSVMPVNTTTSAVAVGSSVAAGMTRYVTFVAVSIASGHHTKGTKVWLCSTAASSTASTPTLASANAKMVITLASDEATPDKALFQTPDKIDTDKPLFTIAAGKWFTVAQSSAQAGSGICGVFVQYYDE